MTDWQKVVWMASVAFAFQLGMLASYIMYLATRDDDE